MFVVLLVVVLPLFVFPTFVGRPLALFVPCCWFTSVSFFEPDSPAFELLSPVFEPDSPVFEPSRRSWPDSPVFALLSPFWRRSRFAARGLARSRRSSTRSCRRCRRAAATGRRRRPSLRRRCRQRRLLRRGARRALTLTRVVPEEAAFFAAAMRGLLGFRIRLAAHALEGAARPPRGPRRAAPSARPSAASLRSC